MSRWLLGVGALAIAGGLIFLFLSYRLAEREAQCRERCAAAGARTYAYTAPRSARRMGDPERCECIR
jgi:hypothetical protein